MKYFTVLPFFTYIDASFLLQTLVPNYQERFIDKILGYYFASFRTADGENDAPYVRMLEEFPITKMIPSLITILGGRAPNEAMLCIFAGIQKYFPSTPGLSVLMPHIISVWKGSTSTFAMEAIIDLLRSITWKTEKIMQNSETIKATLLTVGVIPLLASAAHCDLSPIHKASLSVIICDLAVPDNIPKFIEDGGVQLAVECLQDGLLGT